MGALANGNPPASPAPPAPATTASSTSSRAARLKAKKKKREAEAKLRRRKEAQRRANDDADAGRRREQGGEDATEDGDVIVEYVEPTLEQIKSANGADGLLERFEGVFQRFANDGSGEGEDGTGIADHEDAGTAAGGGGDGGQDADEDGADDDEDATDAASGMSRKEKKIAQRKLVVELKKLTTRPEVIEIWDTTAADPHVLVHLKSSRNTVPVPVHWSQKRKYLQGKRGLEKPPWELPEFIAATGISTMRDVYREKEETQKLKSKSRERIRPKTGKLDIDYQVLHDAFFRFQTKPKLSSIGDLYYEGKEFEASDVHQKKPGNLSTVLMEALGMPEGAPPPWLINMQRYGPPPSYPDLKVPGLNSPIPSGASYGYHSGGWGKPPVDEHGRPVYGNPFDHHEADALAEQQEEEERAAGRSRWGELVEVDDDDDDDEEEEEEEDDDDDEELEEDMSMLGEDDVRKGIASVATANDAAPADLRKQTGAGAGLPPAGQLYQVLQTEVAGVGDALMGSDHRYVVPGQAAAAAAAGGGGVPPSERADGREVTLRPEEIDDVLEGDDQVAFIADKYAEAGRREKEARLATREDFSDMVAEHTAGQKRKSEHSKKQKESKKFKF